MGSLPPSAPPPVVVTFSGLDGAGKSTQIAASVDFLEACGYRVRRLAFWDDVVVLTRYREGFVRKVFHSEPGVGAPDRPVARRDKNMRGWHLSLVRHLLYLLDTIHLRMVVRRQRDCDVVVLDRYIYDELVNLPLSRWASRAYARALARLAPRPRLAMVLDADPEQARARKPEYPLEFMHECRGRYLQLARLLGEFIIIPPLPLTAASQAVLDALRSGLRMSDETSPAIETRRSA